MTVHASDLTDLLRDDLGSPRDSLTLGHMLPSESPAENALLASRGTRGSDSSAVFKPVNLERNRVGHMDLPPTPPPTRSTSAAQRPCETPKSNKACAQNEGSSSGTKRTFGFLDDDRAGLDDFAADAAPASASRPSRQCKDLSLKRIRQAVQQDSPNDDDEGETDPSLRDRRAAPKDTEFHARLHSMSSADREKVALETRHKGPCSYEHCPNPTHSSGGGFKFVTEDTKAGARDWSPYWGRVFCNACFTQYATRGTLQRPGRFLNAPAVPSTPAPPRMPTPEVSTHTQRASRSAPAPVPVPPPTLVSPTCEEEIPTVVQDDLRGSDEAFATVELEIVSSGNNLRFQWMRDGRPIPGAVANTLIIRNPGQCAGDFTCKVMNENGAAPPFLPVRMPISLSEAKLRYATRATRDEMMSNAKAFRLTCKCGSVREGEPAVLCEPCAECGLEVCGTVEPARTQEPRTSARRDALMEYLGV